MSLPTNNQMFKKQNPWFVEGQVLRAIDGEAVATDLDFEQQVSQALAHDHSNGIVTLTVHDAVLPLEREVALVIEANGVSQFGKVKMRQSFNTQGWALQVLEIAPDLNTALNVGDTVISVGANVTTIGRLSSFQTYILKQRNAGENTLKINVEHSDGSVIEKTVLISSFVEK